MISAAKARKGTVVRYSDRKEGVKEYIHDTMNKSIKKAMKRGEQTAFIDLPTWVHQHESQIAYSLTDIKQKGYSISVGREYDEFLGRKVICKIHVSWRIQESMDEPIKEVEVL